MNTERVAFVPGPPAVVLWVSLSGAFQVKAALPESKYGIVISDCLFKM